MGMKRELLDKLTRWSRSEHSTSSYIPLATASVEENKGPGSPRSSTSSPPPPTTSRSHLLGLSILLLLLSISLGTAFFLATGEASFLATSEAICTAEEWSSGSWILKNPPLTTRATVYSASSFKGCAGFYRPDWYFATAGGEMSDYRWNAAQYQWDAPGACAGVGRVNGDELVRQLVEGGGWMIIGDSISEEHFFSLSCDLFPHVRVEWSVLGVAHQSMFLRKDSPLIPSLNLPAGFSFSETPLVTNLRSDQGFDRNELETIFAASTSPPSTTPFLSPHPVMSPPSSEFFSEFTNSSLNYHALIWSTAPHWHKKAFAWPPSDPETSLNIFRAWEIAVEAWVREAGKWLEGDERGREVLFRASSSGHDDCHAAKGPTKEVGENPETLFNWDWIPRINEAAKVAIEKASHPRISYLAMERPGRLRPDAHNIEPADCLHIAVGTGVIEGWTAIIQKFLEQRL